MIDPVARLVALFNQGVRTGDLSAWCATFADDAVLVVDGAETHGRAGVEAYWKANPPGSQMLVTAGSGVGSGTGPVFAEFVWESAPATGGRFTAHLTGRTVDRFEITHDGTPP